MASGTASSPVPHATRYPTAVQGPEAARRVRRATRIIANIAARTPAWRGAGHYSVVRKGCVVIIEGPIASGEVAAVDRVELDAPAAGGALRVGGLDESRSGRNRGVEPPEVVVESIGDGVAGCWLELAEDPDVADDLVGGAGDQDVVPSIVGGRGVHPR